MKMGSGHHERRSTLLPDQRGSIGRASIDTDNDGLFAIYDSMEAKGDQQNAKILMREYSAEQYDLRANSSVMNKEELEGGEVETEKRIVLESSARFASPTKKQTHADFTERVNDFSQIELKPKLVATLKSHLASEIT